MPDYQRHRPAWRRIFTVPNAGAVLVGFVVFLVLVRWWNTYLGAIAAATVAAVVTGVAWWLWWNASQSKPVAEVLSVPQFGSIPVTRATPAPTLTEPDSAASRQYASTIAELAARTDARVLLVSSPMPGQGASTVALNMAISATRGGRRVVLIDGDYTSGGLSRYGRTGAGAGLVDLAAGEANLVEASRLWTIDASSRLPFIPCGFTRDDPEELLEGPVLADAIDRLRERADLMLIDTAPVSWNGVPVPLAAHADGTILVVNEGSDPAKMTEARDRLEEAGAPVVGYVLNRAATRQPGTGHPVVRGVKRALATFGLSLFALAAWNGIQIWTSWANLERDALDVASAAVILPIPAEGIAIDEPPPDADPPPVSAAPTAEEEFMSFLIVGSDLGGFRADVIILTVIPIGDDRPMMVSIPRDLYLPNRCTRTFTRVNAALAGCGEDVNGPTLLALTVEDFTGVPIDHFALFDFGGFERIIDEVGGIDICVDNRVRDTNSGLDLPAGCTIADGDQALAWVRSRRTEELIGGTWRSMPGVNDLTRNERQQEVILAMLQKLRTFESVADLTRKVRSLTNFFTFDDRLGISEAIGLAWDLRSLEVESIVRLEIPVQNHTTSTGAAVLVNTLPFDELLETLYPDLAIGPT